MTRRPPLVTERLFGLDFVAGASFDTVWRHLNHQVGLRVAAAE